MLAIIVISFAVSFQAFGGQSLSLDGQWAFATDSSARYTIASVNGQAHWRTIQVPGSWQAQCADLREYQGVGWYRKLIAVPTVRRGESALLTFGAVDYAAEVFVNGSRVGSHEGGYTPFSFDVAGFLHSGANVIIVRVVDPVTGKDGTEGYTYRSIPHGKQSWYVQTSGLWQSVRMDMVTPRRVSHVQVTASASGDVTATVRLTGPVASVVHNRVEVRIRTADGKQVTAAHQSVKTDDTVAVLSLHVQDPSLWSPATPVLYQVEAGLDANAPTRDRFGFRTIETREGKLLLNGQPYFLIGALDQDFYPVSVYTTPSEEFLKDEMLKAKRVGLNTLRCHIKAPDPRYLKVADEVGLLVWYEIPNWDTFTPEAGRRGENTMREMLLRDWNHPSLVILSIINESWGIDMHQPEQRAWLRVTFDRLKVYAVGRLVVDNSACDGNFHVKSDLSDWHTYWTMPSRSRDFDRTVAELASRPPWLFSPYGDAASSGKEPILLSEFGTWGLPAVPDPAPWWMAKPFGSADVVLPQGYTDRFSRLGLNRVFGSYREMLGVSQRAQSDALKYQIEQLRFTPGIEGYVITEFTDINWECNGILDMWRNIKECGAVLPVVQQQDVIVARTDRFAYWSDERPKVQIRCARYTAAGSGPLTLRWATSRGDSGSIPLPPAPAGTVTSAPLIELPAAGDVDHSPWTVRLRITNSEGRTLATNTAEYAVYPRIADGNMQNVLVTSTVDSSAIAALQAGGSVLCLMDSTTVFPARFPLITVRRDTGWYDGNWASALSWVRSGGPPFHGICRDNRLGFESAGTPMPYAVRGIPEEHADDVLAGLFIGWVHRPAGFVVQLRVGQGKLIVCAIPLKASEQTDPFAATLLHSLRTYAVSADCRPRWEWTP